MNKQNSNGFRFIQKAKLIHNDRYLYENVIYHSAKTKVSVTCPEHGDFSVSPDNHLRKRGCPKCKGKSLSTSDFIILAQKKHNNKYDYSISEYKNKSIHINIICSVHHIFQQLPSVHLAGSGCPKCVGRNKTNDEIIEEAKRIHSNKYEYFGISNRKDSSNKIRTYLNIYCPNHNHSWEATIDNHISKKTGCTFCGDENSSQKQRSDFSEIIKKITHIHPDYIIPPKQEYLNQHSNIKYHCSIHGIQKGRPINLINGEGCPVCGQEKRNIFFRDDWNTVIKKITEKHPNYFIDPEQPFLNHHTPIVFKCNLHGNKISNANSLLSKGSGCDECGNNKRAESQKSDWKIVLTQIELIHSNITIDTNQTYLNTNTKVTYSCKKHGKHTATPSKLLQGRGCPKCAIENHQGYSDSGWIALCGTRVAKLYWIEMSYENEKWVKFGRTFVTLKDRFWELKKLNIEYTVIKIITGEPDYICKLERRVHKFLKKFRYTPKIDFGGRTECFKIKEIPAILSIL